ncbi:MAG TPA: glycosyltransferase [Chitinophagaceae bacterium]|nr:glycosyltransferase [Chitinophagaceae bacterium]
MEKHLHIISLTVPYPVNYGGVYDLFYKLPALQEQGVKIHLHCFDYGRGRQQALEQFCESVQYYTRNTGYSAFSTHLPYVVSSRKNDDLLTNLLKDDYPILMEGIHCTYLLTDERFAARKTVVRLHNVEFMYYRNLFNTSHNIANKLYYNFESRMLKAYEKKIAAGGAVLCAVSPGDRDIYRDLLGAVTAEYLPLFLPPEWKVQGLQGMGTYCLYHGDLGIEMNEKAATWLLKLFSGLTIPLVIAGKNPSKKLQKLVNANEGVCLVANPALEAMQDMIAKAHINILPSFSNTGIKIKLLNALFNGRHCIVNSPTAFGTGLEALCHVTDTEEGMRQRIEALYQQPFTEQETNARRATLSEMFSNTANAKKLTGHVWG